MYVCLCRAVTSSAVVEAMRNGSRSVADIRAVTGAGTDCRGCTRTLKGMLERYRAEQARAGLGRPDE